MIPINAFKCSHCKNKVLESYSGMWKHEKKCFYNPESKSCATCKYLTDEPSINGRKLTQREKDIFSFKVEGTYYEEEYGDHYGVIGEIEVLNDDFKYLNEVENKLYCEYKKEFIKLTTKCNSHLT